MTSTLQLVLAVTLPAVVNTVGFMLLRGSITDLRDSLHKRLDDLQATVNEVN
jgi:hypothetical protein